MGLSLSLPIYVSLFLSPSLFLSSPSFSLLGELICLAFDLAMETTIPARLFSWLLVLLTTLLLLYVVLASTSKTTPGVVYEYDGPFGPEHWGELVPEWRQCGNGQTQSPIAINKRDVIKSRHLAELQLDNILGQALLQHTGHGIGVQWKSYAIEHSINKKTYRFDHLHFHSPSEHTVNGIRYPLEVHKLHESDDGHFSVISILYKYGKADTFIEQISSKLHWMTMNNATVLDLGILSFNATKLGSRFYRYQGSLTTPPCTELVTWTIMGKVRRVSKKQVQSFKEAIQGENARPLQSINGRSMHYYN